LNCKVNSFVENNQRKKAIIRILLKKLLKIKIS